jgi:hypothetical protein
MNVTTANGVLHVPRVAPSITLSGRQAKVVVTNYRFGDSKMLYSTASVLFAGKIGDRDVLFLHGDPRHTHEARIHLDVAGPYSMQHNSPLVSLSADMDSTGKHTMTVTFLPGVEGLITVQDTPTQLVLYADSTTAGTFWAPTLRGSGALGNFWQLGTNASVLIGGPHLVRSAEVGQDGRHLSLKGDLVSDVRLFVFVPPNIRTLSWNGMMIAPDVAASAEMTAFGGAFVATLASRTNMLVSPVSVPKLKDWRFADSLPEVQSGFKDINWTVANRNKTNIPFKPYYGNGTTLYGCDYGL